MKNAIIKMTLIGILLAGAFEASSAPLSTLYIDDYYEVLKKRYYTTSMPSSGLPSKKHVPEPVPVRPILPGPVSPKKPVKPETPPPVQDVPDVNLPRGNSINTWPSAYKGTWALKIQPYSQNTDELLMMRAIDGERVDVVSQDGTTQIGELDDVADGVYTINTVSMCECANNVAYKVTTYTIAFNRFDEMEGKFTDDHYTAGGSLVSSESGDVTGTLFNFNNGR